MAGDFLVLNSLEDGEIETRIRIKDVTAKEVTVGGGSVHFYLFSRVLLTRRFYKYLWYMRVLFRQDLVGK